MCKICTYQAVQVYQTVISANVRIVIGTSDEAELAKLTENAFLASKVTLFNAVCEVCERNRISYHRVREMVVADPRISPDHSFVYPDRRGFDGACLPKDTTELTEYLRSEGVHCEMLRGVLAQNESYDLN